MPEICYRIQIEPSGRRVEIHVGESLLDAVRAAGVDLVSVCGGMGICRGCLVRIVKGEVTEPVFEETEALFEDELEKGFRLACQTKPLSDCKIDIPAESLSAPQRLQLEGGQEPGTFDPAIMTLPISLAPPTLHDLTADAERIIEAVQAIVGIRPDIPRGVLEFLSKQLRDYDWQVRVVIRRPLDRDRPQILGALPPEKGRILGLAVDTGTTKLAAYLVDLETGETIARQGAMNPQVAYGEDVISRILYANQHEDGLKTLQVKLVEAIQALAEELTAEVGVSTGSIFEAVIVGNTAMHHLLAGLPVRQLGTAPFVQAVGSALEFPALEIGLHFATGAMVYLPPNIAGYVGADHVAMLLGSGAYNQPGPLLALDIGTNTEISLVHGEDIWSCSCASGPAFEGAHIQDGMRAASGAIERVQYVQGELKIHTIGDKPPVGICGSGILDGAAALLDAGAIDRRGNFRQGHPLVNGDGTSRQVELSPAEKSGHNRSVAVTRKDINEIQLAKGAIRAGIEVLLCQAGLQADQVEYIVAGAFGTYLDVRSAIRTGMFPNVPARRFSQVGNAAGAGARSLLISRSLRLEATSLARRIRYIELTIHPNFNETFLDSIQFPEEPQ